ncbi:Retinoid-inducible serine carboxypeptidase [Operophtera brumata]|uniref:Retinoid-inducible serine carboxypeptidase n=1 Tax=Operophtera brumata TaxID=104452 RepID=A0A0L7LFN5_OPEBR|nr:Retinoid-inducible serine carboxypeptidase [Operophtera brumata]
MDSTVAGALGISNVPYDSMRTAALAAVRDTFMIPAVDKGQLEWVNNLQWDGHEEFLNSTRETFVVNRVIEGYFRETDRLKFYWMNAAGQSVPIDSPVAMRRFLQLVTGY